mmetsp:Transcript_36079/g.103828  ORF Transcript_36079/g.103828 Transcript_36079/m.103828 type:complete len:540 (-) Transcript_36079:1112-2731(-)
MVPPARPPRALRLIGNYTMFKHSRVSLRSCGLIRTRNSRGMRSTRRKRLGSCVSREERPLRRRSAAQFGLVGKKPCVELLELRDQHRGHRGPANGGHGRSRRGELLGRHRHAVEREFRHLRFRAGDASRGGRRARRCAGRRGRRRRERAPRPHITPAASEGGEGHRGGRGAGEERRRRPAGAARQGAALWRRGEAHRPGRGRQRRRVRPRREVRLVSEGADSSAQGRGRRGARGRRALHSLEERRPAGGGRREHAVGLGDEGAGPRRHTGQGPRHAEGREGRLLPIVAGLRLEGEPAGEALRADGVQDLAKVRDGRFARAFPVQQGVHQEPQDRHEQRVMRGVTHLVDVQDRGGRISLRDRTHRVAQVLLVRELAPEVILPAHEQEGHRCLGPQAPTAIGQLAHGAAAVDDQGRRERVAEHAPQSGKYNLSTPRAEDQAIAVVQVASVGQGLGEALQVRGRTAMRPWGRIHVVWRALLALDPDLHSCVAAVAGLSKGLVHGAVHVDPGARRNNGDNRGRLGTKTNDVVARVLLHHGRHR